MFCATERGAMRFTTTPFLRACKNGGWKKLFATQTGPSLVTVENRADTSASGEDHSPLRRSTISGRQPAIVQDYPEQMILVDPLHGSETWNPHPIQLFQGLYGSDHEFLVRSLVDGLCQESCFRVD